MSGKKFAESHLLYSIRALDFRGAEWCNACSPWFTEKAFGVLDKSGGAQRGVYRHFYSGREAERTTANARYMLWTYVWS